MYYLSKSVDMSFEEAVAATRQALKHHHFLVLAEVDLREILKRHLAVDSRPYIILSACSPQLTQRAIEADNKIGPLLACNLLIHQHGEGPVEISAADPTATIGTTNQIELIWIARELRSVIEQVLGDIGSRPTSQRVLRYRQKPGRQLAHALP